MNYPEVWMVLAKSFVVCIAAIACSFLIRRRSAASRHLLWLGVVTALLVLPLASGLPRWQVNIERSAPVTQPAEDQEIGTPISAPPAVRWVQPTAPVAAAAPTPSPTPVDWERVALMAWASLSGLALLRLMVGLVAAARLAHSGRKWQVESSGVEVRLCPRLVTPATLGFLRPVILLPEEAEHWPAERLAMVLAHELAHVRRRDWLYLQASQVACAFHAVNPLAWIVASRLRADSEQACDDFVLNMGFSVDAYASELVDIAKSARTTLAATVGMAHRRQVESRVASILSWKAGRGKLRMRTLLLSLAIALGGGLVVTCLHPQIVEAMPPESKDVIVAKNYEAVLPSGLRVRLRGITDKPASSDPLTAADVWRPDGSLWKGQFGGQGVLDYGWANTFIPVQTVGSARALLLELEASRASNISVNGLVKGRYESWNGFPQNLALTSNGIAHILAPNLNFGMPATSTYHLAIADGPWSTVSTVRSTLKQISHKSGITVTIDQGIVASSASAREGHQVLWSNASLKSRDWRVIPVDEQGQDMATPNWMMNRNWRSYRLTAEASFRVRAFRIESRPWAWIEFRDLAIEPPANRHTIRRGTADGDAVTEFDGGASFHIHGIASTTPIGGYFVPDAWWRMDGRLLSKPPMSGDGHYSTRGGIKHVLYIPITLGVYRQSKDPIGPCMIAAVVPEKEEEQARSDPYRWIMAYGNGIGTTLTLNADRAGDRATAIVGVANGPWKSIARVSCDVSKLQVPKGKHRFIGFALGQSSWLECAKTKIAFPQGFDPLKYGVHVVAVDAKGNRYTLKSDIGGSAAGLNTHFDPDDKEDMLNASANHASIVAFELETCPYTFKTIRNIALKPRE